jgi:large subunit ribosomal protein L23
MRQIGKTKLGHDAIIIRPLLTEKAALLEARGKYMFEVAKGATKPEVKKAVEALFHVTVTGVSVINRKGKPRMVKRRRGSTSGYRKAVVSVKEGDKIEVLPT